MELYSIAVFSAQVINKLKIKFAIAVDAKKAGMDDLAAPSKKQIMIDGPLKGKLCRIVKDSHHLCGVLIDVTSHAGTKIIGQSVYKNNSSDFLTFLESLLSF